MKRQYDVSIGYFKQGDDLANCMENKTDTNALIAHAKMLQNGALVLKELAGLAKASKLKILIADTHTILVECDEKVADKFVSSGVFYIADTEEEYENEEGSDEPELEYDN